jgi:L-threonylcarbamoyladenylate synthase
MLEVLRDDDNGFARAAVLLRAGELVGFGTETVYGLGADATNDTAVAAIFAAKQRPRFNPLICHYPDVEAALVDVQETALMRQLARAFWPGPLTLVLPRRGDSEVSLLASAGLDTLAVRIPAHPASRRLLRETGRAVAAPSANVSGRVSPTTASHVMQDLGNRIAAVLDCGPSAVGVESTVLDLSGDVPLLLRPGGTTVEALAAVIGPLTMPGATGSAPRSPGQLASHYAPTLPLRLDASAVQPDEALLAFGPPLPGAGAVFSLSDRGDLVEAAGRLFSGLRQLDAEGAALGLARIAAMPVPEHDLGRAVNDRLRRAATRA